VYNKLSRPIIHIHGLALVLVIEITSSMPNQQLFTYMPIHIIVELIFLAKKHVFFSILIDSSPLNRSHLPYMAPLDLQKGM